MKGILVSKGFVAQFGAELQAAGKAAGVTPEIIHLPDDPAQRLSAPRFIGYYLGVYW